MKKILNLGAGNRIIAGADNHDIVKHRDEINLVFNLDDLIIHSDGKSSTADWKFEIQNQKSLYERFELYDEIQFISVIEHLSITPIQALDQCWHLLKPDGKLIVKYPHAKSSTMDTDPTHRWRMNEHSFDYVDPDTQFGKDYNYYTNLKWKILTPVDKRLIVKGGNRINVKMELTPRK